MSHPDYNLPPYSFFAPPGAIAISDAALKMARDFLAAGRRAMPEGDWIAAFDWGDKSQVREKPVGGWVDLGPGLDLGAYERVDLPKGVVYSLKGVDIAVKIPGRIWAASALKLIDVDGAAHPRLVLR